MANPKKNIDGFMQKNKYPNEAFSNANYTRNNDGIMYTIKLPFSVRARIAKVILSVGSPIKIIDGFM